MNSYFGRSVSGEARRSPGPDERIGTGDTQIGLRSAYAQQFRTTDGIGVSIQGGSRGRYGVRVRTDIEER